MDIRQNGQSSKEVAWKKFNHQKSGQHQLSTGKSPRRKIFWILVSTFLCATYVISIASAAAFNFSLSSLPPWLRGGAVVGALLLALLPILFWWRQTWHFETWIQQNPLNLTEAALEFEKTRFKTNSEFARALWSAIVVIFTALLITTALKSDLHPARGTPAVETHKSN